MKFLRSLLLIMIVACGLSIDVLAATSYVSDQLVLSLRETVDPTSPVIGHLKTDDALEVLAEEGEFVKVSSEAGTGWVRKQYLTSTQPKQFKIDQLEQQVANLSRQLDSYATGADGQQQELAQLRQANSQLKTELAKTKEELDGLQKKHERILADSKNLLEIVKERDQLREATTQLEAEVAGLRDENESLLATGIIKWFLAGAGTLCFGWFMGKISRKKRRAF